MLHHTADAGVAVDPLSTGGEARPPVGRGLTFAAGNFMVSAIVGLASSVATSRLYGIKVIGEYALVSLPYAAVAALSSVNEQVAFVREAATLPPRDQRLSALFRAVFAFSMLLTGAVAAVGMVVATLVLRGPVGRPDLVLPAAIVLAGYVFIDNVGWNIDSLLSSFRSASVLLWARGLQVVTFLVVGVGLSYVVDSVWGLVWATIASFAVAQIPRFLVVGRLVRFHVAPEAKRQAREELPRLIRFGLVMVPAGIVGGIVWQAGTAVVGASKQITETGAYSRALGLASKLLEAGWRVAEILLPGLVERRARGDREGAAALLRRTVRLTAVGMTIVVAAGGGAASGVLRVYGPGFDRASLTLLLLLLAHAINVVTTVQVQGFVAEGMPGRLTQLSILRTIVTVVGMVTLHQHGASGVAASYALGWGASFVVGDRLVGRLLCDGARSLTGYRTLGALTVTGLAGYGVAWSMVQWADDVVGTLLALCAGTVACAVLAPLLGLITADERRQVIDGVSRLRSRS